MNCQDLIQTTGVLQLQYSWQSKGSINIYGGRRLVKIWRSGSEITSHQMFHTLQHLSSNPKAAPPHNYFPNPYFLALKFIPAGPPQHLHYPSFK